MKQTIKSILPPPVLQFARNTYDSFRRIPQLPAAYFHPWRRESIRRLAELKDIHKGKRAFIIQRTFKGQKPAVQARIRADVRLIGAAPDLLDVLIRMVEYADDGTPIHPTDNLMAEARAMVAKAVGAA